MDAATKVWFSDRLSLLSTHADATAALEEHEALLLDFLGPGEQVRANGEWRRHCDAARWWWWWYRRWVGWRWLSTQARGAG